MADPTTSIPGAAGAPDPLEGMLSDAIVFSSAALEALRDVMGKKGVEVAKTVAAVFRGITDAARDNFRGVDMEAVSKALDTMRTSMNHLREEGKLFAEATKAAYITAAERLGLLHTYGRSMDATATAVRALGGTLSEAAAGPVRQAADAFSTAASSAKKGAEEFVASLSRWGKAKTTIGIMFARLKKGASDAHDAVLKFLRGYDDARKPREKIEWLDLTCRGFWGTVKGAKALIDVMPAVAAATAASSWFKGAIDRSFVTAAGIRTEPGAGTREDASKADMAEIGLLATTMIAVPIGMAMREVGDLIVGGITKAFSKLSNLLTSQFEPSIKTFMGFIENTFAPVIFMVDSLVQSLLPQIQEFMAPITAFVAEIVANIGLAIMQIVNGEGALAPIGKLFYGIFDALKGIWNAFTGITGALWEPLGKLFGALMYVVDIVIGIAAPMISNMISGVGGVLPGIISGLATIVKLAGDVLAPILRIVFDILGTAVVPLLASVLKWIMPFVETILLFAEQLFLVLEPVLKILTSIIAGLLKVADKIFDWFVKPLIQAFNYLTDALNWIIDHTVGAIIDIWNFFTGEESQPRPGTKVSENVFGAEGPLRRGVEMPRFAEGGIVSHPTLAQIGERGPEVVVPLTDDSVRTFLRPVLADIKFPEVGKEATDRVCGLLEKISGRLGDLLETNKRASSRTESEDLAYDLSSAVGIAGLAV